MVGVILGVYTAGSCSYSYYYSGLSFNSGLDSGYNSNKNNYICEGRYFSLGSNSGTNFYSSSGYSSSLGNYSSFFSLFNNNNTRDSE